MMSIAIIVISVLFIVIIFSAIGMQKCLSAENEKTVYYKSLLICEQRKMLNTRETLGQQKLELAAAEESIESPVTAIDAPVTSTEAATPTDVPLPIETVAPANKMDTQAVDVQADLPYTEEELDMLARVINGEYGMDWAPDEAQQMIGLVVMNRVNHHLFPNTIKDVIFAPGQYACTWDGNYNKQPSEKAIENARKVLSGNADIDCPPNVVFQSGVPQGDGTFLEIYDDVLGVTTYFCYTNK